MKLPDTQQEVILLKYYHDLSVQEIAEATGSPKPTVKSRLYTGLHKLKVLLGGGRDHEESRARRTSDNNG